MYRLLCVLVILIGCTNTQPNPIAKYNIYNNSTVTVELTKDSVTIPIIYHYLYDTLTSDKYLQLVNAVTNVHKNLNLAFKKTIKFKWDIVLLYHPIDTIKLPDLYRGLVGIKSDFDYLNYIINTYSFKRYFNVYIIKTDMKPGEILLGFTPVSANGDFTIYSSKMPGYDNAFVSYETIIDNEFLTENTLIHETGHWLGLEHPWEMNDSTKLEMGLQNKMKYCINYMNYNCYTSEFTNQQLNYMNKFAKNFRNYLVK